MNISSATPKLRSAAKSLKNNENITIRKADKSNIFVLLNNDDYFQKLNTILVEDKSKFQKIYKDPTLLLKKQANDLISTLNAAKDSVKFSQIIGVFNPGYIYGNVKIHKPNNPL